MSQSGAKRVMDMKAKRVAVYDAAGEDCRAVAEAVREAMGRAGAEVAVRAFTDSEAFVYHFRDNHCDMAVVGVATMLDMETARAVRALDESCPLVLASGFAEYAIEGFRLKALDYLVKPVTAARMAETLGRAGLAPEGETAARLG